MVKKEEIEKIISYCEKIKSERKRIYILERNPFKEEFEWTRRYILIEIDRPKEVASKTSLVYDSTTKQLWHFLNSDWRKIEPDLKVI